MEAWPQLTFEGVLAVIYDKNPMEASGYAAALADLMEEPVYFVDYYEECAGKEECRVRFSDDNVLEASFLCSSTISNGAYFLSSSLSEYLMLACCILQVVCLSVFVDQASRFVATS